MKVAMSKVMELMINSSNMTYRENKGCLHFIGRAITISIKVFVYFVLAIVGISLFAALFGIGAAVTAVYPLKKFVLEDGAQSWSAFGTIVLFIWVPICGYCNSNYSKNCRI